MKKLLSAAIALVLFVQLNKAGNPDRPSFVNAKDVFGTRVFIENKGQFDLDVSTESKVHYALIHGDERMYFTPKGVIHKLVKTIEVTERQREAREAGFIASVKEPEVYQVNMNWLNANENVQIESSEKQSHYFSYWRAEMVSNTYKKITYKNVYDQIDIEYVIPSDKEQGIKYTVICHPGADPSKIKIAYTGDVEKIKLNKDGNVVIKTPLDDLTEHSPFSFDESKAEVSSEFVLNDNIVSFNFPKGYDVNKTLFVDPWVTTVTTLTSNNSAYDVDYDDNGNVYIYGGNSNYKLAKYNNLGVLQWTFPGSLTVPSWVPILASNFVVVKNTGKCYLGQGINGSGTQIIRLDAAGLYDNFITPGTATFKEIWDMAYHCSTGNVYGMGGSTGSNQSAGIVNQITAAMVPIHFIGPYTTSSNIGNDVVSHAIDDAGEFFWVYASASSTIDNHMAKINAAFTTTLWVAPTGYTSLSEAANKGAYVPPENSANGFNCMAVNNSYLYYYDGKNLAAYNKATGAPIASTIFSSHTLKKYGGIAVDDCNNIYFGAQDTIKSMKFNGTTFTPLPHILVGASSSTNSAVYDIRLDKVAKILYVCGAGFVGTYSAINSVTCSPLSIICYNVGEQYNVICAGTSLTITPGNVINLSNPVYSVNPGGLTNTTGTFVVTPLANVIYTTYVTGTTTNSAIMTLTALINVTVNPQPISVPSVTQAGCTTPTNAINLNLSFLPASPVPNYTIAWSTVPNGITSNQQTSTSGTIAPGVYNATITAAGGCKAYPSFTIATPEPATFTISPAGPYTISCYSPSVDLTYIPSTFNYTTNNNIFTPITGPNASFTSSVSAGIWTVTSVNPNSGCVSTQTFVITNYTTVPSSTLSPLLQNITCSLTSIIPVVANISPSVNVEHSFYSPQGGSLTYTSASASFLPGSPGTFTHCAKDIISGCSTCKTFTVTSSDGFPTYSVTSPQNFTLGCTTKSVATINIVNAQTTPTPGGAVSYTILGPPTNLSYVTGTLTTYTVNVPGTWTVITKDNSNFCETKVQISVIQNTFQPAISAVVPQQILSCYTPSVVLQGESTTPNVNYNWSFPGNPGNINGSTITVNVNQASPNNTLIANYTLTIVDNSSTCKSTSVIPMSQNLFKPNALISTSDNSITCLTQTITLTNSSSTGIPPLVYPSGSPVVAVLWEGPTPQEPLQLSSTYIGSLPGAYTMTVKDLNNGCTSVATKTIADFRVYPNVNRPNGVVYDTLDCGAAKTISANILPPTTGFSYKWTTPPGVSISDDSKATLFIEEPGLYQVVVQNTINGCASFGVVNVINGSLKGEFVPDKTSGYAPMEVIFTNLSKSQDTSNITSVWNFGNGISSINYHVTFQPKMSYTQPGTYPVTLYVTKGVCMDTVIKYINVEIPSSLIVPNIFTPNGDGANDLFFLRATNQEEISITIVDRWGKLVYELSSSKGNVEWDGTNQQGKECAEGVYTYVLKTRGKDGTENDLTGTITLIR